METVTGIFTSTARAERASRKLEAILDASKMTILAPGDAAKVPAVLPVTAAEQPGMGTALGSVTGAAVGMAGGVEAATIATALIPGVGPVMALGILGGGLLGAWGGAKAGQAVERAMGEGLPEDEIFVYEDALRHGRSVLIAYCDEHAMALSVREFLEKDGAEAVDAAREIWWVGLRSAEEERYSRGGAHFGRDEQFYRLGFEAALHARHRCQEYDQILAEKQADIEELQRQYPGANGAEPFRRGFERGRQHYEELCKRGRSSAGNGRKN